MTMYTNTSYDSINKIEKITIFEINQLRVLVHVTQLNDLVDSAINALINKYTERV